MSIYYLTAGLSANASTTVVRIRGVTPDTSDTAGGANATIDCTNAEATQGTGSLTIGGTTCTIRSWADTQIAFTIPAGSAGTADIVLTNNTGLSDTWSNAFTYVASADLDRSSIVSGVKEYFKTDGVLYGSSALLQTITANPSQFERAKTDRGEPFKLYMWAEPKTTNLVRTQNVDEIYTISYRIEGLNINPSITAMKLDDIDERIAYLLNLQMHNGNMLNGYYTDSNGQIIDISYDNSNLVVEPRGEKVVAECEGAISITINRWN